MKGGAEATGLAVAVTSTVEKPAAVLESRSTEHVGRRGRLSVVCIFMFHVQQHFPGIWLSPPLAEQERQLRLLPRALAPLPPISESNWAFMSGRGRAGFQLSEKGIQETLPKVCQPWACRPAQAAERGAGWKGWLLSPGVRCYDLPTAAASLQRKNGCPESYRRAATTLSQASFPTVQRCGDWEGARALGYHPGS